MCAKLFKDSATVSVWICAKRYLHKLQVEVKSCYYASEQISAFSWCDCESEVACEFDDTKFFFF